MAILSDRFNFRSWRVARLFEVERGMVGNICTICETTFLLFWNTSTPMLHTEMYDIETIDPGRWYGNLSRGITSQVPIPTIDVQSQRYGWAVLALFQRADHSRIHQRV